MKKRIKKNKKNNFTKKYILSFFCIILLVLSYLEINNNIYITGYFKDVFFLSMSNLSSDEFINGINLELIEENKKLKDIISISNSLSSFSPIYAVVVERNNLSWFNYVTINKGSIDGIEVGMAVVDSFGLVGIVEKVSLKTSLVSLITSNKKSNNISVKINIENPIYSILSISSDGAIINNIDKSVSNLSSAFIFTSGLSDKFPSGILVGKVNNIKSDIYNASKTVYVDIVGDVNNLKYVAVLKRGDD